MAKLLHHLNGAKTVLSRLVERAAAGEEIIIAKAGRPVPKLVRLQRKHTLRRPGGWEGRLCIAHVLDAPLTDDIQTAFEGVS